MLRQRTDEAEAERGSQALFLDLHPAIIRPSENVQKPFSLRLLFSYQTLNRYHSGCFETRSRNHG
jgi:hypothetical protein